MNLANIPDVNTSGKGPHPDKKSARNKKTASTPPAEPSTSTSATVTAKENKSEVVKEQLLDFKDPDSK